MKRTLTRLFRRESETLTGTLELAVPATPVIRYVNALLFQMHESGTARRIIRQSEPLSEISIFHESLPPPPLDAVINRFKVMVGLNPVTQSEPVEGSLQIVVCGQEHKVMCRFCDTADERCSITMENQMEAQETSGGASNKASDGLT